MKTRSILATLLALFLPALQAAQALANTDTGEIRLPDSQSVDSPADEFESHVVKRGTTLWFGKSRNKILDYAAVTTKTGIVKTDHRTGRHYEDDTTRYKLSVVVATSDSSTATVDAKVHEVVRYMETDSAGDILVDLTTGIDLGSTQYLDRQKILSATIVTSLNATAEWALRLETNIDYAEATRHRHGSLAIGDRSIDIIDNRFHLPVPSPASGFGIEFIENEKLLGTIGDGVYLFSRDLDPDLKLVLAAAMETVNFRLMQ